MVPDRRDKIRLSSTGEDAKESTEYGGLPFEPRAVEREATRVQYVQNHSRSEAANFRSAGAARDHLVIAAAVSLSKQQRKRVRHSAQQRRTNVTDLARTENLGKRPRYRRR